MFRRSTMRYGSTPEPVTPYQKAAQIWDERIGSARVQARNWRLIAFGSLFLSAGLGAGLVWQSARGTIVPWVVQVDHLGQAQVVAPAAASYTPSDPQIAWYLARFVQDVRSLSSDPVVVRETWLRAYAHHRQHDCPARSGGYPSDLLAHRSMSDADVFDELMIGDEVNFKIRFNRQGPTAVDMQMGRVAVRA